MNSITKRRDGARLDLQLRVRYAAPEAHIEGEGEATDVSARGARLECREEIKDGTRLSFELDAGDGNAIHGMGTVTWCRLRATPAGKQVWDAGVRFDDDWLKGERGPLARALGRFFSSTDAEPARDYQRVTTHLLAQGVSGTQPIPLTVTDLSEGGLRVTLEAAQLPAALKVGTAVRVTFGLAARAQVDATVAWIQDAGEPGAVHAQFGVAFGKEDHVARDAVLAILAQLGKPDADVPSIQLEVV